MKNSVKSERHFLKYFPIPKFLEMPSVGLSVSDDSAIFIDFEKTWRGVVVKDYAEKVIPQGILDNGKIVNKDELIKILYGLKNEHRLKFVSASLPDDKAYLFKTELPLMDESAIHDAVLFVLEENVPISRNEAVFDYAVIPHARPGANHIDVSVTVIPEPVVKSYSEIFEAAGLVPVCFQAECQAVARAVIEKGDLSPTMVVNFGNKKTIVSIVNKGVVYFSSVVNVGGEAFLSVIQKHFKISAKEALRIKKTGLSKIKKNKELFYSFLTTMSVLVDEIRRLYDYWHSFKNKNGKAGDKIEKIIICGQNALISRFDEYLSSSIDCRVDIANVWTNVFHTDKYVPNISFSDSLDFAAAIGLALE